MVSDTLTRYELVRGEDGWDLLSGSRVLATFDSKAEALGEIPETVGQRGASLFIHTERGEIEEERTYPRSN